MGQPGIADMNYRTLAAVSLMSLAMSTSAVAGEIYKWTDDDGNVHYTDTPMGDSSERLNLQSRDTNDAAVARQNAELHERQLARAEAKAAEQAAQPSQEELMAAAREKDEQCNKYRQRLTTMLQSRRLYREDDNGERVYLDEEEMAAERAKVQGQVEEYCNAS